MNISLFDRLKLYVPNLYSGNLVENFIITAITTILIVRAFLFLTGYPQVGGSTLHIAHMLWGGGFMVIAIFILFLFLNKEAKVLASIIAGIGFGLFIDELGKFITQDNNYFFKPTIAIIYILFVLIFLGIRLIEKSFNYRSEDYAINSLEYFKDLILHDLDKKEAGIATELLIKSRQEVDIADELLKVLKEADYTSKMHVDYATKIKKYFAKYYMKVVQKKFFSYLLIFLFSIMSIFNLIQALFLFQEYGSIWELIQIIVVSIAGLLSLIGIYKISRKDKLTAFKYFKYSVLILILINQVFLFYHYQLLAILGLFYNLTIYVVLRYLIYQEEINQKKAP